MGDIRLGLSHTCGVLRHIRIFSLQFLFRLKTRPSHLFHLIYSSIGLFSVHHGSIVLLILLRLHPSLYLS